MNNYYRMRHISAHNLAKLLWSMNTCIVDGMPCLDRKPGCKPSEKEHIACIEWYLSTPFRMRRKTVYDSLRHLGPIGDPVRKKKSRTVHEVLRRLSKDAMREVLKFYEACPLHAYGMSCPHSHRAGRADECWACYMDWLNTDNDTLNWDLKNRRKEWEKLRETSA